MSPLILLLTLLCALWAPSPAGAAHVRFDPATAALRGTNVGIILTVRDAPFTAAGRLIIGERISGRTDAAGFLTFSNLVAGSYDVEIRSASTNTTCYMVVPETDALLNARDLLQVNPPDPSVTVWPATTSDLRYLSGCSNCLVTTNAGRIWITITNSGSGSLTAAQTNLVATILGTIFRAPIGYDTVGNVMGAPYNQFVLRGNTGHRDWIAGMPVTLTGGGMPSPLVENQIYYLVPVADGDVFGLATNYSDALAAAATMVQDQDGGFTNAFTIPLGEGGSTGWEIHVMDGMFMHNIVWVNDAATGQPLELPDNVMSTDYKQMATWRGSQSWPIWTNSTRTYLDLLKQRQIRTLISDFTFTTANNRSATESRESVILIKPNGADRTLLFPSAWITNGTGIPSILRAGELGELRLRSWGNNESDVVATFTVLNSQSNAYTGYHYGSGAGLTNLPTAAWLATSNALVTASNALLNLTLSASNYSLAVSNLTIAASNALLTRIVSLSNYSLGLSNLISGLQSHSTILDNISGTGALTNAAAFQATNPALTTLAGGNASSLTNLLGTSFRFATVTQTSTNMTIDCTAGVALDITLTNDIWISNFTNAPGSLSLLFWPNGATRAISWSTNFPTWSTNGLIRNGACWTLYASNGLTPTALSARISGPAFTNALLAAGLSQ